MKYYANGMFRQISEILSQLKQFCAHAEFASGVVTFPFLSRIKFIIRDVFYVLYATAF